eukprot:TRINITY_DN5239_c3_g1_i1.p1 TRINITY_DN5239_c3_g1~~TRINITY_DN5239_c3_g1_i1.p1  ORF type:complete len:666 (+),score=128.72 TRINITY_DN5239_c3_g1_i1:228-2225(+)
MPDPSEKLRIMNIFEKFEQAPIVVDNQKVVQEVQAGQKEVHEPISQSPSIDGVIKQVQIPQVQQMQQSSVQSFEQFSEMEIEEEIVEDKKVVLHKGMKADELAKTFGVPLNTVTDLLQQLELDDQVIIEPEICDLIAQELGIDCQIVDSKAVEMKTRPSVVTVMGHVDHGKTSLLDALRNTSVAAGEAGGITQHIGAFEVSLPGFQQNLTFLDTPGHAAFTAMRSRGAQVTDLVVLVVAANETVMPQTKEAIAHARAAGCPIVVALTKIDLASCNTERVKNQLLLEGLELEEVGGDVPVVMTSAVSGQGLQELSEALLLQADLLELKAAYSGNAEAYVIETKVSKGLGATATVIVQKGELKVGDCVVVGKEFGKVRSLKGPGGKMLKGCTPGQAAEISGLRGLPNAGDRLQVVASEERASKLSRARERQQELVAEATSTVETVEKPQESIIPVVVKADVQGSVEALLHALEAFKNDFINLKIVHTGVGMVSESDVQLAKACQGRVVGLNVTMADSSVVKLSQQQQITVATHKVIYHLLDEIAEWLEKQSPYESIEEIVGSAEVLAMFPVKGKKKGEVLGLAAGCVVYDGYFVNNCFKVNVIRDGTIIYEGGMTSLRHHKLDVERVAMGKECGIFLKGFKDFQEKDILQCVTEKRVKGFKKPSQIQ